MQTSFNQKCLFACLVIFVNLDLSDLRYLIIDENSISRYQLIKNDILITRVNGSTDIVGSFTY